MLRLHNSATPTLRYCRQIDAKFVTAIQRQGDTCNVSWFSDTVQKSVRVNRPVNVCESRSSRRSSRTLRSPTMKIGSLYPTTQSRVSDKSSKNADGTDAEPGRYITATMQVDFPDVIRVHSNSNEVGLLTASNDDRMNSWNSDDSHTPVVRRQRWLLTCRPWAYSIAVTWNPSR